MKSIEPESKLRQNTIVALFGEWNTTNLGDTAIGIAATRFLIQLGFQVKVFAFGSFSYLGKVINEEDVAETFHSFRPLSNDDPFRPSLPDFIIRGIQYLKTPLRIFRSRLRSILVRRELSECRAVVVGGGELLNLHSSQFSIALFWITKLVRESGLSLYCLGCGSGRSFSKIEQWILKRFAKSATLIAVRDNRTREIIQEITDASPGLSGDFVSLFAKNMSHPGPGDHIGINIKYEGPHLQQYEGYLMSLILALYNCSAGVRIILFTTGNREDFKIAHNLKSFFKGYNLTVVHPKNLEELRSVYQQMQVVLASRLHAALLAWQWNVPVVGICGSGKLKAFFETLNLDSFCYSFLDNAKDRQEKLIGQLTQTYPGELTCPRFSFADEWDRIAQHLTELIANTEKQFTGNTVSVP